MDDPRHRFRPGRTWFFTVALADRARSLLTDGIDTLGAAFRHCRARHPFETIAIVVLPEHLHCLWALPEGDTAYALRWSLIKRTFTRRQLREGPTTPLSASAIWQPRFLERPIVDDEDLRRHVEYIHYNPVKHGHVAGAADWTHSSFRRYVAQGWLTEAWRG